VDLGDSREKNLKLIYPVVEGGSGAIDGEGTVAFASLARPDDVVSKYLNRPLVPSPAPLFTTTFFPSSLPLPLSLTTTTSPLQTFLH
jgi:hypothetical protein